jgi:outer membrane protein
MKSLKVLSIMACLVLAGVCLMPKAHAQDFKGKVAYVDLSRMFDEYEKTKSYDKVLEADNQKFQEERTKKIDMIRDLQGKTAALKDDEKAKVEKDIEKLKAELLAFDQQKRTDLTKARDEKVREILMEIEKTVSEYAKKEGYAYVFNDRVLIYGDQSMNITEPILKSLNEAYTKQDKK